jgi:uncharacterized protein YcbK (DUF882 family)
MTAARSIPSASSSDACASAWAAAEASRRAIDVRLRGVALADLRDAGLSLGAGGVAFYPRDQFVYLDTGRVRAW